MMSWLLLCTGKPVKLRRATVPETGDAPGNARASRQARWPVGLALAALGAGMALWLLVLQRLPVGVAYPMLSLNFVWVTLAARFVWRERVTARHAVGVLLIIIGIVLLGEFAMKGVVWALMSVLLVSVAQLLLRSAMQVLPPVAPSGRLSAPCCNRRKGRSCCCLACWGMWHRWDAGFLPCIACR